MPRIGIKSFSCSGSGGERVLLSGGKRRRGNGPEQNGPAVCLLLCLSFGLWRSDKEPEEKVILRLWLCQQATNPPHKAQLTWSCLSPAFTTQTHMKTPKIHMDISQLQHTHTLHVCGSSASNSCMSVSAVDAISTGSAGWKENNLRLDVATWAASFSETKALQPN